MAFEPDAATQALINQMLLEDLRLVDAQPSTWGHQTPAALPQPPLYQPSDKDLYGNASEDESRSIRKLDEENRDGEDDEYD